MIQGVHLLLILLAPFQSKGTLPVQPGLAFPEIPDMQLSTPLTGTQGELITVNASSLLGGDLDGDKNADLALVTGPLSPMPGLLVVMRGKGQNLGRFRRAFPTPSLSVAATTAARHSSVRYVSDQVVYGDPASSDLGAVYWDPLKNEFKVDPAFLTGIGLGVFEMASADLDGNGHDELYLLRHDAARPEGTAVIKLSYGPGSGGSVVVSSKTETWFPVKLSMLVPADLDGDGQGDVALYAAGLGVAGLRHDATAKVFRPLWVLTTPAPCALRAGRLGKTGPPAVDLAITFPIVTLVVRQRNLSLSLAGIAFAPAGAGLLKDAVFCDGDGDGDNDLVVQPAAQRSLLVFPAMASSVGPPQTIAPPPKQGAFIGPGGPGKGMLAIDVDNDGDRDLVVVHPSGHAFFTVRSLPRSLAPYSVTVVPEGLVPGTDLVSQKFRIAVPPDLLPKADMLEAVVYQRLYPGLPSVLRPLVLIDKNGPPEFRLYYLRNRTFWGTRGYGEFASNGTMIVAGDVFITVHGRRKPFQRFESFLIDHPYSDGEQSALSIRWVVNAAPPLPDIDEDWLPWY